MSEWLNNKRQIFKANELDKPCHTCGYCPYGALVEEFPLLIRRGKRACKTFGHNCPAYYMAEHICED